MSAATEVELTSRLACGSDQSSPLPSTTTTLPLPVEEEEPEDVMLPPDEYDFHDEHIDGELVGPRGPYTMKNLLTLS